MRKTKCVICLLMAAVMIFLSACGKENSGNETLGRYIENDITPPVEGRIISVIAQDGTIICYDEGLNTKYESTDNGDTWNESPGPGGNTSRYDGVTEATLLSDGRLLVYSQGEGLIAVSEDGSVEHIPFSGIDGAVAQEHMVMIYLLQAVENDRVILNYMAFDMAGMASSRIEVSEAAAVEDEPQMIAAEAPPMPVGGGRVQEGQRPGGGRPAGDAVNFGGADMAMTRKTVILEMPTGREIAEVSEEYVTAVTSDNGILYVMDIYGAVHGYNLSDGTASGVSAVHLNAGGGNDRGMVGMFMGSLSDGNALAADGNGGIYAVYGKDLIHVNADGETDTVLPGTAYAIGSPNGVVSALLLLPDGGFIVNMSEISGSRLYRYIWDENATINPDRILTVWSLEDNAFVRAAIAELRKQYNDALISYEVAITGDGAVTAADAIRTLNTRMISGEGPDIIILDGTPAERYAGNGILLDLTDYIDISGIYGNLIAPYNDGGLYYIPTQFALPALIGSAEALGRIGNLQSLVNVIVSGNEIAATRTAGFNGVPEEERSALYFDDLREVFDMLWVTSAPAVIEDNRLDSAALREFLEAVSAINNKYGLTNTDAEMGMMGVFVSVAGGGGRGLGGSITGSLMRYTMQAANYGASPVSNLMILQMMMERDNSQIRLFPGPVDGVWLPTTTVGISSDTAVPDFAAQFIQTMLSLDVQQINYGEGLPVTRDGIAAQINDINEMLRETGRGPFNIDMDSLIAQLVVPSPMDSTLTEIIWGSVGRLGAGELNIDGAVNEIEQNVRNFLAERS